MATTPTARKPSAARKSNKTSIPVQATSPESGRQAPSNKTTKVPVETETFYYAGAQWTGKDGAIAIQADLVKSGKLVNSGAKVFAHKLAEAYARGAHKALGIEWEVFTDKILGDFSPSPAVREMLVTLMRDAGMENKAIAAGLKVSERTIKRLNVKTGKVNVNRQQGQITGARSAVKTDAGTVTVKSVVGARGAVSVSDPTDPRPSRGKVVSATTHDARTLPVEELVKDLAARKDVAKIMAALFLASQHTPAESAA